MSIANATDLLTFSSYREQRFLYPDVAPERWELVYGPEAAEYEKRLALEVLCASC